MLLFLHVLHIYSQFVQKYLKTEIQFVLASVLKHRQNVFHEKKEAFIFSFISKEYLESPKNTDIGTMITPVSDWLRKVQPKEYTNNPDTWIS